MQPARPASRTWLDGALVAAFALALAAPLAKQVLAPELPSQVKRELRLPAPLPPWPADLEALGDWPRQFEDFFSDRFEFRPALLRAHNWLKLIVFGSSPDPMLEPGRDGFLHTTSNHALGVFRGADPMSAELTASWAGALEDRRLWCAERGIHYAVVWVPASTQIYPESMPLRLQPIVGPTRLDQLCAALATAAPDLDWLDLRPPLREARAQHPELLLYRKLDSHWNANGALFAYHAILRDLQRRFPALEPRPFRDFEFREQGLEVNDWGQRLYLEDLLSEPRSVCVPRFATRARSLRPTSEIEVSEVDDASLPSAVIFHDSFGGALRPLLREHFRRAEFHWRIDFDARLVELARPDIVLTIIAEPNLVTSRPAVWPRDTQPRLAAEFARATEPLLLLSMAGEDELLQGTHGLHFEPALRRDGPVLLLHNPGGFGYAVLPELPLPPRRLALLRLQCHLERASTLEVDFCTADDALYSRYAFSRCAALPLQAGSNDVYLKLHVPDLRGNLRFRVSNADLVVLRGLEVQAVPADGN